MTKRRRRIVGGAIIIIATAVLLACFDFEENQIDLTFVNETDVDLCYYSGPDPPTHMREFCARIGANSDAVWSYGCGPGDLTTKSPIAITMTERESGDIVSEHVGDCSEWLESPPIFTIRRHGGDFAVDQR